MHTVQSTQAVMQSCSSHGDRGTCLGKQHLHQLKNRQNLPVCSLIVGSLSGTGSGVVLSKASVWVYNFTSRYSHLALWKFGTIIIANSSIIWTIIHFSI